MKRLAAAAALAAVAGCATAPVQSCVRLSAHGWFCPVLPRMLEPRTGTALVTVARAGKQVHYLGQLAVTDKTFTLALASLAGVPLVTVSWDGRRARLSPRDGSLKPGLMIALLQLTLAPRAVLDGALYGLRLSVDETAGGSTRRLTADGRLVALAYIGPAVTRIEVPKLGLAVILRPLPQPRP